MKLENQVTSLELSQKLKELGFPQESLLWWVDYTDGKSKKEMWSIEQSHKGYRQYVSAYTVAELGEMLPRQVFATVSLYEHQPKIKTSFCLRIKPVINGWRVAYYRRTKRVQLTGKKEKWLLTNYNGKTEADARAKMLIYLLEKSIITIEDLV